MLGFSLKPSGKGNWTAPRATLSPSGVGASQPLVVASQVGLPFGPSDLAASTFSRGAGLLLPDSRTPGPRAGEGRGCSEAPPPLSPASPTHGAVRACAEPHLGAAMMVGVLQRRRSPGARWARRAGGGCGGRGGLALMSHFVSPQLRSLPRRAGPRQPRRKAWTTAPTSSRRRTAE